MTIYLDAGHGGFDPVTGKYTTKEQGGGKFFPHPGQQFHLGNIFCEGVFNRQLAKRITAILIAKGVNVVQCYHEWQDTTLRSRCMVANTHERVTKANGIFISIHANAANGKARGCSVWTSNGKTNSDDVAENILNEIKATPMAQSGQITVRQDKADGDGDYEADFYVLKNIWKRAVLIETLFFDNLQDARLLHRPDIQQQFAEAICEGLLVSLNQ